MSGLSFTPEQCLPKIKQYCAYQERCHKEVKEKLYSFGLHKTDVEYIISKLIEEDYLNEERFAILYAGSKFRLKHWGKIKIKQALKEKFVSEYCIKKALSKIDPEDYEQTLRKLAEEKLRGLKGERNVFIKKRKLQDFLLQKGYGYEEIKEFVKNVSIGK